MSTAASVRIQHDSKVESKLPAQPDVSVIIVNYNVREFLAQALRSLQRASTGLNVEIYVVDNNSVDGSTDMVRRQFPEVKLIANKDNAGFSKANNQAIRKASGRYLFILNPDTIVREDTLRALTEFMDAHPEAGAVGCKILNPDGTFARESRRAFPTPAVAFYRISGLSRLFPKSRRFGRYNLTYLPIDQEAEVDALSGSCMMVRHDALYQPYPPREDAEGAGLFDENFFMYGEDLDWCYRIQQAGWKILYTPSTQIIHYKGESTKKGELRYVRLFYGAMLRFIEKHFHSRHSALFRTMLRLGIMGRAGLHVVSQWTDRLGPVLRDGLIAALMLGIAGIGRFLMADMTVPTMFLTIIVPVFALTVTLGIAMTGGYKRTERYRARPVLAGATLGFLVTAAGSFFAKEIAFSRFSIGVGFALTVAALVLMRKFSPQARRSQLHQRKALLVGDASAASYLGDLLGSQLNPLCKLEGYVAPEAQDEPDSAYLGTFGHLRDLIRLRKIEDVIFADRVVPNQTIFTLIQQLRDLPVEFRILNEERDHMIGRARIDDLRSPSLVVAERALSHGRSTMAHRAFDVACASIALLFYPIVWLLARRPATRQRLRLLPRVLAGQRALVGYRPEDAFVPPPEWGLKPGLFAITDLLPQAEQDANGINRAYWFYVQHQSASLDFDIMFNMMRNEPRA